MIYIILEQGINVLYLLNVIRELNGWVEGVLEERKHLVKAEEHHKHQEGSTAAEKSGSTGISASTASDLKSHTAFSRNVTVCHTHIRLG